MGEALTNPDGSLKNGAGITPGGPPTSAPTPGAGQGPIRAGANGYADDGRNRVDPTNVGGTTSSGKIADNTAWGGYGGSIVTGPDGKPVYDGTQSGVAAAMGRLQMTGADAQNRTAAPMNFAAGDAARGQSLDTRNQQNVATSMLGAAARGNAPSAAVIRGQGATDGSFMSQLRAQAGARGGAAGQAAANNAGAMQAGGNQLNVASSLGAARSGELTQARQAYGAGSNLQRTGDLAQQTTDQQRARGIAENDMSQRQLNDQRQLGYEGLAYGAAHDAMNAGLNMQEQAAGQNQHDSQRDTDRADKVADFYANSIENVGKSNIAMSGGDPNAVQNPSR